MTNSTSATLGLHPRYLEISRNGRKGIIQARLSLVIRGGRNKDLI